MKDGIHDSGCSLKIYRRECFEGISLYGEMHRFIPALLKIKGFTTGEIVVNYRPRTVGLPVRVMTLTELGDIAILVWLCNQVRIKRQDAINHSRRN